MPVAIIWWNSDNILEKLSLFLLKIVSEKALQWEINYTQLCFPSLFPNALACGVK